MIFRITHCTAIVVLAVGSMLLFAEEPQSSLEITIPEYEVTMRNGNVAYVSIPGGEVLLAEQGRPRVPYVVKTIDYPSGYRVQDIELVQKSGFKSATGLHLPVVAYGKPEQLPAVAPDWYPGVDFTWESWENRDASTTVVLKIYPFHYHPATTDIEFYTNFLFDITYVKTDLSITHVALNKEVYDPGDEVGAEIDIGCGDDGHDVVLSSVIRQHGTERIVYTLPDEVLKGISGKYTASLTWSTDAVDAGDYIIEVMLNDAAGHLLDKDQVMCRLGSSHGEVTYFDATPRHFARGDKIDVVIDFKNTGTRVLAGNCVFKIKSVEQYIKVRTHEFNNMKPGSSLRFSDTWDTRQANEGEAYYVVSYVMYNGTATAAQHIMISTNAFPEVHCTFSPEAPKIKEKVVFDASQSTDSDGEIIECAWDFGDGARATGIEAMHQYMLPGEYMVLVTVTDNDGGTVSDSLTISIVE